MTTKTKNQMSVMNKTGDVKVEWDPAITGEVDIAREVFNAHKKKGHAMFRMTKSGGRGERIEEFDRYAEKIVVVPPVQGGQ